MYNLILFFLVLIFSAGRIWKEVTHTGSLFCLKLLYLLFQKHLALLFINRPVIEVVILIIEPCKCSLKLLSYVNIVRLFLEFDLSNVGKNLCKFFRKAFE